MQQLNSKTVPVNLAAAIQIVSEAIRRRKERNESQTVNPDVMKTIDYGLKSTARHYLGIYPIQ
jgi:hypothetical protein